ncbi:sugar phosphate isomerase/epimerase family protein [Thalassoroseus pseudoceratinae]|uniref:sugar phosphate isomerase/epimerase family protein n=1 Tax=Thalassoroseus pseudoceratinae TaxID=2713176 RepID=UPI001420A556|nr:TIM barrel protein [Thalassoroseus pseudoceratinae]
MSSRPQVILSAFADEAANHKTAIEQFVALSAIGLSYYSPRFLDVHGNGEVKHVVELNDDDLTTLKTLHDEFGMKVTSIGSRIGKVKLLDQEDGSHNKFVPFQEYLDGEVAATIRVAVALETKLIRGFSFYHPQGDDPAKYLDKATEQLTEIVNRCASEGLIYGLEIEPNLIGETGQLLEELHKRVNHDNMVLIFDGGNVAAQDKNPLTCYDEYTAMRDGLGWMHIKDYARDPGHTWMGDRDASVINEDKLKNFVPANIGDSGHEMVLRDLKRHLPALTERMQKLGVPGFFLEVEPHLKGGGQFGGFSGPDGTGVAVRALCEVLDYVGIDYKLRDFDDIRAARGF